MKQLFDEFVLDRRMTERLSPNTIRAYNTAWRVWGGLLPADVSALDDATVRTVIRGLWERKLAPSACNAYGRILRTWLNWLFENKYIPTWPKVPKAKVPITVPLVLSPVEVKKFLMYPARFRTDIQVVRLVTILIDTGLRAEEGLSLRREHIDLEASTIHVDMGKGAKSRVVPCSRDLVRRLYGHLKSLRPDEFVFETKHGRHLDYTNALRTLKKTIIPAIKANPEIAFHTFRHTFATNYIRSGGSVAQLQRILGHSNVQQTMRYVTLQTEDLVRGHSARSMLGSMRD